MNPRRTIATILATALATILATAAAQPTDFERNTMYVLANDAEGIVIDCPAGYPITDLAACFRLWGSRDLAASTITSIMSAYGDANWVIPWNRKDQVMIRTLAIDGEPHLQIVLTPWQGDEYETVVWVIQADRWPE